MTFCLVFAVSHLLVVFLLCRPTAFSWDKTIRNGHCGSEAGAYIAIHSINTLVDIFLAVLPTTVLWKMQMATKRKIELSFLFGLGILCVFPNHFSAGTNNDHRICAISLVRIALYKRVESLDITYDIAPSYLFTILEPLLGIVLASLPVMRPAGVRIFRSQALSWVRSILKSNRSSSSYLKISLPSGVKLTPPSPDEHAFTCLPDNRRPGKHFSNRESISMADLPF